MSRFAEPNEQEPGLFRGAFRPLKPRRAENELIQQQRIEAEEEMGEHLAEHDERDQARFIQQAIDGYQEQDRRAERAERRATTLLGSISIITAVLGATGAVLASSDRLEHIELRIALALSIVLAIGLFGLAALYSLQVLTSSDHWRRTATPLMLEAAGGKSERALYIHTAAALIDSIRWNQEIADRKALRLRRASIFFGYGLRVLLAIAVVFVLLSAFFPASKNKESLALQSRVNAIL